jgi:hypothetical protein
VHPLGAIVGHVFAEETREAAVAENDDVSKELAPTGADPSSGERVLPGGTCDAHRRKAHAPDR